MKLRFHITIISILLSVSAMSQSPLPLDTILKRSMSAAEKYNDLVESYRADVYMRTYIETQRKNFLYKFTHLVPRFVLHDPKSDEAIIETLSTLKFDYPSNYIQDVKHATGTLTGKKDIDMIPFYLLNINVYGETTNSESFFMPVRKSTKKYYVYKLTQSSIENGRTYYTIEFKPIYENSKLLKGNFVIESGTWRIVHFNAEGAESFTNFSFEITMGDTWVSSFLPVNYVIFHTASYLGNVVASRHLAQLEYHDVTLRSSDKKEKNLNISDLFKVRLDSIPVENDSLFWAEHRTIPLQAKELDVINNFKQNRQRKASEKIKQDSLQNGKKMQLFAQRMVMDSRYKVKSTMIGYSGLLNPFMVGYSSVDGVTYRQKLSLDYAMKRNRSFKIDAFAGYIFKRRDLITDITSTWNYEPYYHGNLSLSVGIGNPSYSSVFIHHIEDDLVENGVDISNLNLRFYRDYYVKLFNDYELFNGFVATIGAEYHLRKPTQNNLSELYSTLRSTHVDNQVNQLLSNKKSFAPYIRLSWTPEQYYRYEGYQKIYVRSRFPTFKIELSQGMPDVLGGTSGYNRIEFDISQNIPFGLMNSIQYHFGVGKFTKQKTEYFADFSFFSKNYFPDNWGDEIGGSFNLLNRHYFNYSDSYAQGHIMIESPFLILRNIPLISDFINRERIYISQLYTPQIKSYTELGYGIGNRFFKTANAAIFCSFFDTKFNEVGVKASFEL